MTTATKTRTYAAQKGALTRALKAGPDAVREECARVIREWNQWGYWPDDWSRWQRALSDTNGLGWTLDDLR